jgi:hypothetical protein
MTVDELISRLERLDRNMELMCLCDDEGTRQASPFRVFVVEGVNVSSVTHARTGDRTPKIEFNGNLDSRKVVVFKITTDF